MSTLSGATPELRAAKHLFVEIEQLHGFLDEWTQSRRALAARSRQLPEGAFPGRAAARLGRLAAGAVFRLRDSRQPGQLLVRVVRRADRLHGLDAAVVRAHGEKLDDWWRADDGEIHHFIGKDITYFHTLFWPGMLKTAGFSLPAKVHIHGFLTVDGEKMSKTQGHVRPRGDVPRSISTRPTCATTTPRSWRRGVDDLDLNRRRVRRQGQLRPGGQGRQPGQPHGEVRATRRACRPAIPTTAACSPQAAAEGDEIAAAYEACDYNRAMRLIMALADRANQYVDAAAPWKLRDNVERAVELQDELHDRAQSVPAAGDLSGAGAAQLAAADRGLVRRADRPLGRSARQPLVGVPVNEFTHMMKRVEAAQVAGHDRRKPRGTHR